MPKGKKKSFIRLIPGSLSQEKRIWQRLSSHCLQHWRSRCWSCHLLRPTKGCSSCTENFHKYLDKRHLYLRLFMRVFTVKHFKLIVITALESDGVFVISKHFHSHPTPLVWSSIECLCKMYQLTKHQYIISK